MGRKAHLQDKQAEEIVQRSVTIILDAFERKDVSTEIKIDLAKHFILKAMPQKVDTEGLIGHTIIHLIPNERAIREDSTTSLLPA